MALEGTVAASDGSEVEFHVETICTHGDTPGAQALTRALRAGLERAGVTIAPLAVPAR
jgi:UPF0271 protein